MSTGRTEVAVLGGGVIGLSCAWRLASSGTDVEVIDPEPGRGASWAAGGMLAPVSEVAPGEEHLLDLGLRSVALWPGFAAELEAASGQSVSYTQAGTIIAARDSDETAEITRLHEMQTARGLASERLSGRDSRRLEPALATTVRGALWLSDDHQVDNRRLLEALLIACDRAGVTFTRHRASHIEGNVVHLESTTQESPGSIQADTVVVATGAWQVPLTPPGAKDIALTLRVNPLKGQIIRVQGTDRAVMPTHTVRGPGIYVVPRDHGEIAIGATVEDMGFDTSVTAGGMRVLLQEAWELVPGLAEATFVDATAGLRPATPDNTPLIGRLDAVPDVVAATGHYRGGILLAPLTAELVTELVIEKPGALHDTGSILDPCAPGRFGSRYRAAVSR